MNNQVNVCVLGSINMDLVVRAPRFAVPGETVLGGVFETFPGGKGANQAIAAARMGAQASLIGCVGDDAYGNDLLECISACEVDITGVETRTASATGVGMITIDTGSGENTIVVASGANMLVTEAQIEQARGRITQADCLLMQLEVPMEANVQAAGIAQDAGVMVVLNAAPAMDLPAALLQATDVLIVNRAEAIMLSGLEDATDPSTLLDRLSGLGVDQVVVTLGAEGAVCRAEGRDYRVEAPSVEALDTVGAGDAFCGVLAAVLGDEQDWTEALRHASAAGGLAVTKPGAIPALPHHGQLIALARTMCVKPLADTQG